MDDVETTSAKPNDENQSQSSVEKISEFCCTTAQPPHTVPHTNQGDQNQGDQNQGDQNLESQTRESKALAEMENSKGNVAVAQKLYGEAVHHYTQAVTHFPDCPEYYGSRSYCLLMLHRYIEAITDAQRIVELDPSSIRGWNRLAQCHLARLDVGSAVTAVQKAINLDANHKKVKRTMLSVVALQKYQSVFIQEDYQSAMVHLQKAELNSLVTLNIAVKKAECLSLLGLWCEANYLVDEILQTYGTRVDVLYLRGMCLYHQDYLAAAARVFKHVLHLQPDHQKAVVTFTKANKLISKLKEGNKALSTLNIIHARGIYAEALTVDAENNFTNSKLHYRLARVEERLGHFEEALSNFTSSLMKNDGYIEAYVWRGVVYKRMGCFQEACEDFEKVIWLRQNGQANANTRLNGVSAQRASNSFSRNSNSGTVRRNDIFGVKHDS